MEYICWIVRWQGGLHWDFGGADLTGLQWRTHRTFRLRRETPTRSRGVVRRGVVGLNSRLKENEPMQDIVDYLSEHQLMLIPIALFLAVFGYAIVKRLLKLVLFLAMFLAIFAGLLYMVA